MAAAHGLPSLGMFYPALGGATGILSLSLNAKPLHALAHGLPTAFDPVNASLSFFIGTHQGDPAVTQFCAAIQKSRG